MESVYQNPMPYFMLGIGMEYPVTVSNDHILRQYVAVDNETLEKINHFMGGLLPYVNSGQKPDIKKLAEQYDLDYESAQGIYEMLKNKIS